MLRALSRCHKPGLLLIAVHGLLLVVASLVEAQTLGTQASVVMAHRLSCFSACEKTRGLNLSPALAGPTRKP